MNGFELFCLWLFWERDIGCTPNIKFDGWLEKTGCDVIAGFGVMWLAGWAEVVGINGAMPPPLKPSKPVVFDFAAIEFKDVPKILVKNFSYISLRVSKTLMTKLISCLKINAWDSHTTKFER